MTMARFGGPARSFTGPLAGGPAAPARSWAGLALGPLVGLRGARLATLIGADRGEAVLGDAQRKRSAIFVAPPPAGSPALGFLRSGCPRSSLPSTLRDALPVSLGPSSMAPSRHSVAG
jgi:hypothetical protein